MMLKTKAMMNNNDVSVHDNVKDIDEDFSLLKPTLR